MKADTKKSQIKYNISRKFTTIPDDEKRDFDEAPNKNDEVLVHGKSGRNKLDNVDDTIGELERRVHNISIDTNVKSEPKDIEEITNNIQSLQVEDDKKEDEDDRIARGPDRSARFSQNITTPYVKSSTPNRLHQCGGQIVENLSTTSSLPITYLNNDYVAFNNSVQSNSFSSNIPLPNYKSTSPHQADVSPTFQPLLPNYNSTSPHQADVSPTFQPLLPNYNSTSPHQADVSPTFQDAQRGYGASLPLQTSPRQDNVALPVYHSPPNYPSPPSYDENSILSVDSAIEPDNGEVEIGESDIPLLCNVLSDYIAELTRYEADTYQQQYPPQICAVSPNPEGVNIPYLSVGQLSPHLNSVASSGYESSTSTPSNSPGPNNSSSPPNPSLLNSYYQQDIPLSVEQISSTTITSTTKHTHVQQTVRKYPPILPKPTLTYTMQEKLYKFIISLEKEHIIKRIIYIVNKNPLEMFTKADKEGDTALIKLATNSSAVNLVGAASSDLLSKLVQNPLALRLACLYAIVQRLDHDDPKALHHHNKNKETALHVASMFSPECPIIAAYIAETLQRHRVELNERCCASGCEEGGTLLHCLASKGDSHANVVAELLKLPGAFKVDALDNKTRLTPLQTAIKVHGDMSTPVGEGEADFRAHKMVDTLITHGASLTVRDGSSNDCTPLQMALKTSQRLDLELLEVLLKAKNNAVNVADSNRSQPIHYAVSLSYHLPCQSMVSVLELLVKYGASVKQDVQSRDFFMNMLQGDRKLSIHKILFPKLQHVPM